MFEMLSPSGVAAAAVIAPPGPEVIAALAELTYAALPAAAQVDLLIGLERQAAWLASLTQLALAGVGEAVETATIPLMDVKDPADLPLRAAHAEIGGRCGWPM